MKQSTVIIRRIVATGGLILTLYLLYRHFAVFGFFSSEKVMAIGCIALSFVFYPFRRKQQSQPDKLESRFTELQNQLADSNPMRRANAVIQLTEIARQQGQEKTADSSPHSYPFLQRAVTVIINMMEFETDIRVRQTIKNRLRQLVAFVGELSDEEVLAELIQSLKQANVRAKDTFYVGLGEYLALFERHDSIHALWSAASITNILPNVSDEVLWLGIFVNDSRLLQGLKRGRLTRLQRFASAKERELQAVRLRECAEQLKDTRDLLATALQARRGDGELDLSNIALIGAELGQAQLRGVNFEWAQLQWANLEEAKLNNSNLHGAVLWKACLRSAVLCEANLSLAQLQDADLSKANLEAVNAVEAFFRRALLQASILKKANLAKACLEEVDLSESLLEGATLEWTSMYRANLRRANLQGAQLTGADLTEADLSSASLKEAILRHAKMEGARICGADLRFAHLEEADLQEADLSEADLTGADLTMAQLQQANLSGAILREATLIMADLRETILHRADLTNARLDMAVTRDI